MIQNADLLFWFLCKGFDGPRHQPIHHSAQYSSVLEKERGHAYARVCEWECARSLVWMHACEFHYSVFLNLLWNEPTAHVQVNCDPFMHEYYPSNQIIVLPPTSYRIAKFINLQGQGKVVEASILWQQRAFWRKYSCLTQPLHCHLPQLHFSWGFTENWENVIRRIKMSWEEACGGDILINNKYQNTFAPFEVNGWESVRWMEISISMSVVYFTFHILTQIIASSLVTIWDESYGSIKMPFHALGVNRDLRDTT